VPASQTSVATLTNVTHRYGSIEALSDVTFDLEAGQVTALLGPNGAGKTTIVRLLAGLTRPTKGRAVLFGGDPQSVESRRRLGVMLQVARVPETLTVSEHITLFSSYDPSPLPLQTVLRLAGLDSVADRRYGKLSGGQQQRTLFGLAVCGNPGLLFLDEPTVGMDVESRRQFWSTIRDLAASGRSILLTTHYLEEAEELCDRVAIIDHGRVIEMGSPEELVHRYFNEIAISFRDPAGGHAYRTLEGVTHVTSEEGRVTLYSNDVPHTMAGLLNQQNGGGVGTALRDLNVHNASLEDVFLKLTGRALRD